MQDSKTIMDYSEMAETDLLAYARLGSQMAFSELYRRSYQGLLEYIEHWQSWDSEDIAQEAFLRAHQYLSDFREDSSFATWIRKIAKQLIIQNHRNTPQFLPLNDSLSVQKPEDVVQSLENKRLLSSLETFIKTLPPAQREALEQHIYKGLSYARISQKTGKKAKTLRKACQRAFGQCRKFYDKALPQTKLQKNSR